jgi:hypothetical protein
MTDKHARDAVYVVTLTEELRNIEARIATLEKAAGLRSSAISQQVTACHASEEAVDGNWIRTKSRELNLRLRRIEKPSEQRFQDRLCHDEKLRHTDRSSDGNQTRQLAFQFSF